MIYLQLFYEFFKTGLFAVGGGLATIPFLSAMTDKYTWFTKAQLADMIAVAESTPGPIGVNTATFAGYNAAGIPGAIIATFSLVLPSYIIILAISKALQKFRDNKYVNDAFTGLRPAATGLIGAACYSVMVIALSGSTLFGCIDLRRLIFFALLLAVTNIKRLKGLHPIIFIAIAAVVGIVFRL